MVENSLPAYVSFPTQAHFRADGSTRPNQKQRRLNSGLALAVAP
jgi:hypothetical protein